MTVSDRRAPSAPDPLIVDLREAKRLVRGECEHPERRRFYRIRGELP